MWNIIYLNCGERYEFLVGHPSYTHNLSSCEVTFFIFYGYITNSQYDQLPDSLIAQSVEHCTGIAEVMRSNPFRSEFFFSGYNFTIAQVVCITAIVLRWSTLNLYLYHCLFASILRHCWFCDWTTMSNRVPAANYTSDTNNIIFLTLNLPATIPGEPMICVQSLAPGQSILLKVLCQIRQGTFNGVIKQAVTRFKSESRQATRGTPLPWLFGYHKNRI